MQKKAKDCVLWPGIRYLGHTTNFRFYIVSGRCSSRHQRQQKQKKSIRRIPPRDVLETNIFFHRYLKVNNFAVTQHFWNEICWFFHRHIQNQLHIILLKSIVHCLKGYFSRTQSTYAAQNVCRNNGVWLLLYLIRGQQIHVSRRIGDDVTIRAGMRLVRVHSSIETQTKDTGVLQNFDHQLAVLLSLSACQSYISKLDSIISIS